MQRMLSNGAKIKSAHAISYQKRESNNKSGISVRKSEC